MRAPYWSLKEVVERGLADPFLGSEQEAFGELEMLLRGALKMCMVTDVPLGAFLSDGVDSSGRRRSAWRIGRSFCTCSVTSGSAERNKDTSSLDK